tara:strand:- start:1158 stop:1367 length:210 start_codon:yes stop_codon:yes gene_type:complete
MSTRKQYYASIHEGSQYNTINFCSTNKKEVEKYTDKHNDSIETYVTVRGVSNIKDKCPQFSIKEIKEMF